MTKPLSPTPQFVDLRMPQSGKLIARYDPRRDLLQVVARGEKATFDLAEMRAEALSSEEAE